MASFDSFPDEILLEIIQYLSVDCDRFPTRFLLNSKRFCHLLMLEQVKHLRLTSHKQLSQWLAVINAETNESTPSTSRYQNLLDRILKLSIESVYLSNVKPMAN